jgi:hypothetical protein
MLQMRAAATRFNVLKELLQRVSYFIHLSIAGGYVKMRSYVKMSITGLHSKLRCEVCV